MKASSHVNFYLCSYEDEYAQLLENPCDKWIPDWAGTEFPVQQSYWDTNPMNFTAHQLFWIDDYDIQLDTDAQENVTQCELGKLAPVPEPVAGFRVTTTTRLDGSVTSSDSATTLKFNARLNVPFGQYDTENPACPMLPYALFNQVVDTGWVVYDAIDGGWEWSQEYPNPFYAISWGSYGEYINFDVDYSLIPQAVSNPILTRNQLGSFWPIFQVAVPADVITRVDENESFNYIWVGNPSNVSASYAAIAVEYYHVDNDLITGAKSIFGDSNPEYIGQQALYENPQNGGAYTCSAVNDYGMQYLPASGDSLINLADTWGLFELRYILLASGFKTNEYFIRINLDGSLVFRNMHDQFIDLKNLITHVAYTEGESGLLLASAQVLRPIHIPTYVEITITAEQVAGWLKYTITFDNLSNLPIGLMVGTNHQSRLYQDGFFILLQPGQSRTVYHWTVMESVQYDASTQIQYAHRIQGYLTEKDGSHSEPINLPQITYDESFALKALGINGVIKSFHDGDLTPFLQSVGPSQPQPTVTTALPVTTKPFYNLTMKGYTCRDPLGDEKINQYLYWHGIILNPLGNPIEDDYIILISQAQYLGILINLGLNPDHFKIKPSECVTFTPQASTTQDVVVETVYTLTDSAVTSADVIAALNAFIAANTIDFVSGDCGVYNHFGCPLSDSTRNMNGANETGFIDSLEMYTL